MSIVTTHTPDNIIRVTEITKFYTIITLDLFNIFRFNLHSITCIVCDLKICRIRVESC
jgi:hypothetical protein